MSSSPRADHLTPEPWNPAKVPEARGQSGQRRVSAGARRGSPPPAPARARTAAAAAAAAASRAGARNIPRRVIHALGSRPPAGAGPAPLAAIKWLVKEMQVSACGGAAVVGDVGCVPVCASGSKRERELPGDARRLGSRPRRAHTRRPERVGQRLALTAAGPPASPPAARRPPPPRAPSQPEPSGCSSPSASSPSRGADRQPPRGECRYFAVRIICRTPASLRSALIFSCLRPLPPEKKTPLLKQSEPEASDQSQSPTGGCSCAVLSCSLFWACVE